ncbi:hypothetical protein HaLaN_19636 [Haematococcus lacustris]|uniref:Uncharacterized protein n=1 Tax=Haematococcus lacustris TaxID=44745 RepID=A0A699ZR98_HAELA|nr:hypothetical protein HaLaN_19636 [Haematococcus lacustris]
MSIRHGLTLLAQCWHISASSSEHSNLRALAVSHAAALAKAKTPVADLVQPATRAAAPAWPATPTADLVRPATPAAALAWPTTPTADFLQPATRRGRGLATDRC